MISSAPSLSTFYYGLKASPYLNQTLWMLREIVSFFQDICLLLKELHALMGNGKSTPMLMPQEVHELHVAVMRNDIDMVRRLVNSGIDVNYPWQSIEPPSIKDGSTPLCEAVSLNHAAIVKELIHSGALVNKPDNFGCTPLHKSAYHGRAAITELLIKSNADVNQKDHNLNTPLQICAQSSIVHNSVDTLKALIKAGADVNDENQYGKVALHYTAIWGLGELTEVLIKAKSDINHMDFKRKTPLYSCIRSISIEHKKREIFQLHLPAIKVLVLSGCDTLNLASWLHQYDIICPSYHMDEEFYEWYRTSQPESLKQLSRLTILKQMQIDDDSVYKISLLPLPHSLIDYLSRKQL